MFSNMGKFLYRAQVLGEEGNETVWDLYCGIGTISLLMATKARKVYGVEIVPQAIEDIRTAPVIHNRVCDRTQMEETVRKILGV